VSSSSERSRFDKRTVRKSCNCFEVCHCFLWFPLFVCIFQFLQRFIVNPVIKSGSLECVCVCLVFSACVFRVYTYSMEWDMHHLSGVDPLTNVMYSLMVVSLLLRVFWRAETASGEKANSNKPDVWASNLRDKKQSHTFKQGENERVNKWENGTERVCVWGLRNLSE
jgi:hypothetical protein